MRVLVIRYGAFGDMVLSMAAFRTIRAHHSRDDITVLTTPPYVGLLQESGYFDRVLIDQRYKFRQLLPWLRLARRLRAECFDRVYDLQRNERTALLYRVLRWRRMLEWSGVVRGASHHVTDDPHDDRHVCDKLAEQLAIAGIGQMAEPDISWLRGDVSRFGLPPRYALIAAGGAPHRLEKRAPARCFAGLGQYLLDEGIAPVLLGTEIERDQIDGITASCPGAVDLCGQTSFGDIAELARGALGAVGNDTGAMHLIALAGCPALVLFSAASDPNKVMPRGRHVQVLRRPSLSALSADAAIAGWRELLG
jgi:ADP-heptose:LPS heptosyltransferase